MPAWSTAQLKLEWSCLDMSQPLGLAQLRVLVKG
jgi:hypothetical protein